MKLSLVSIIFCFIFSFVNTTYANTQKSAEIKFESTIKKLGLLAKENNKRTCVFRFTNTGDKPLVIHEIKTTCGCAIVKYSHEPAMPGEAGEIEVNFDGSNRSTGYFKKAIVINSNATNKVVRIFIEGTIAD